MWSTQPSWHPLVAATVTGGKISITSGWLKTKMPDGSWTGYSYWYGPLATAFNVNILEAALIPPQRCDATAPSPQVDKLDLALISKSRGQVPTANDPRDANGDGKN